MYEPITLKEMVDYFKNGTELFVCDSLDGEIQISYFVGICTKIEILDDKIGVYLNGIYNSNGSYIKRYFDLDLIGLSKNHAKALSITYELDQLNGILNEVKKRKAELERELVKLVQGKNNE